MEIHIHVHEHADPRVVEALAGLHSQGAQIMATVAELTAAIARIDTATNLLAEAQTQNATALADVADDVRRLLEGATIPDDVRTALEAAATKVEAVASTMKAQADTLTGIGASVENPVP